MSQHEQTLYSRELTNPFMRRSITNRQVVVVVVVVVFCHSFNVGFFFYLSFYCFYFFSQWQQSTITFSNVNVYEIDEPSKKFMFYCGKFNFLTGWWQTWQQQQHDKGICELTFSEVRVKSKVQYYIFFFVVVLLLLCVLCFYAVLCLCFFCFFCCKIGIKQKWNKE